MQAVTATISKGSDANIRHQNPDVLLRQRMLERERVSEFRRERAFSGGSPETAPSTYMMLISRIDNMVRRQRPERELVERLHQVMQERIAGMLPGTRRTLLEIPQLQALEVENPLHLPRMISNHLLSGTRGAGVMELLKAPAFAAAMKDENRAATYGPHGLLQAS